MVSLNVKQLLEAGVHFGHQTRHWNPKMAPFIFGERNGIYIIDLEKTMQALERACQFLRETAARGGTILLVGTKKQAQTIIQNCALKCGMPYVNQRWLGGMLTNFETIRKSIARLEAIERMEREGTYQFLTKKEVSHLQKERGKLNKVLEGVRSMAQLPQAIFIIDPGKEEIALAEATRLGISVVALIDTNTNPDLITFPIPGNDDATRSVTLICEIVAGAIAEGRGKLLYLKAQEEARLAEEALARERERVEREQEVAREQQARKDAEAAKKAEPAEGETPEAGGEAPVADKVIELEEEIVEKLDEKGAKVRTSKAKTRKGSKAKE